MPSVTALRVVVGATLGLGGLDLALINLVLAPAIVDPDREAVVVATAALPVVDPPAPPPVAPPSVPVDTPRVVQVYFDTNSAVLDSTARMSLAELAARSGAIAVIGHADIRGPEAFNRTLSKQRAEAVAAELIARGVTHARIRIAYAGAAEASTTGPLWRDRRVEIQIGGNP